MYFDIHSHILPEIDDGAKNLDNAVELLKLCKQDNISWILATPHFYPEEDALSVFLENRETAYSLLMEKIKNSDLPTVYIGSEILYFRGMGFAEDLENLCLNKTNYILIELSGFDIDKRLFKDLDELLNRGYMPIIAHFERYRNSKGFNKLLKYIKEKRLIVQINSASVLNLHIMKLIKKILKQSIICVLATDTHSLEHRPPRMREALAFVKEKLGNDYYSLLIRNSKQLYEEIIGDSIEEQ